jgi:hypothetical protein
MQMDPGQGFRHVHSGLLSLVAAYGLGHLAAILAILFGDRAVVGLLAAGCLGLALSLHLNGHLGCLCAPAGRGTQTDPRVWAWVSLGLFLANLGVSGYNIMTGPAASVLTHTFWRVLLAASVPLSLLAFLSDVAWNARRSFPGTAALCQAIAGTAALGIGLVLLVEYNEARPDELQRLFVSLWPVLVLFDALFLIAILLGAILAKRMAASGIPSLPGEVKTEARPSDGSDRAVAPAPAKEHDGKQLCYLCGKPLRGDELAARVCQACRA